MQTREDKTTVLNLATAPPAISSKETDAPTKNPEATAAGNAFKKKESERKSEEKDRSSIVAQHTNCDAWPETDWEEALFILDTVRFDESKTEGGIGQHIPESENDTIAVMMSVSKVTPVGLTVQLRQYDKRDIDGLSYGGGYTLERLEGETWVELPRITEDSKSGDTAYRMPQGGQAEQEINWEGLYGKLPSGTYRICKMMWDSRMDQGHVMVPLYPLKARFYLASE